MDCETSCDLSESPIFGNPAIFVVVEDFFQKWWRASYRPITKCAIIAYKVQYLVLTFTGTNGRKLTCKNVLWYPLRIFLPWKPMFCCRSIESWTNMSWAVTHQDINHFVVDKSNCIGSGYIFQYQRGFVYFRSDLPVSPTKQLMTQTSDGTFQLLQLL